MKLSKGLLIRDLMKQSDILFDVASQLSNLQDEVFEAHRDLDRLWNLLKVNEVSDSTDAPEAPIVQTPSEGAE